MLRMIEVGLMKKWTDQYQPKPYQCLNSNKKDQSGPPPRLSLDNLLGAFLILLLGYVISFLLFFGETFLKCVIKRMNATEIV